MKKMKKSLVACFVSVIAIVGMIGTNLESQAETSGNYAVAVEESVEYVPNADLKESERIKQTFGKSAPTMDGYLFGGWYQDKNGVKAPIKTEEQKNAAETIYAKFVPAHVMSIKMQNYYGTANTNNQTGVTQARIVSGVDSLGYEQVGYEVWIGDTYIGKYETKDVYSRLIVKNADESTTPYEAKQLFGDAASKFMVMTLSNIAESLWSYDIYVRPYWKTFDGVTVKGLAKYVYVQDGIDGWISVPINLHTGDDVAAGMVSVTVPDGLEFKECRAGVLFEEMNAAVKGNVVNCVGNVKELANVSANDMYITLRFKVTDPTYKVGGRTFLDFTMNQMEFCDVEEKFVPMKILDVRY